MPGGRRAHFLEESIRTGFGGQVGLVGSRGALCMPEPRRARVGWDGIWGPTCQGEGCTWGRVWRLGMTGEACEGSSGEPLPVLG